MMATTAVVTPSSSREVSSPLQSLQSKAMTRFDWQKLEREHSTLPTINQVLEDTPDLMAQDGKVVRYTGLVQDMLDVEYFYAPNDDETLHERTPLVLTPVPYHSSRDACDEEHRDKRHRATDRHAEAVMAKFYYEHYPKDKLKQLLLNQVVTVVGVIENVAEPSPQEAQDLMMGGMMMAAAADALSHKVPRLHVLYFHTDSVFTKPESIASVVPPQEATQLLSQALGVSETVAAAVYMTCMSKAERDSQGQVSTTPYHTALGCASLQLLVPEGQPALAQRLYQCLKKFMPAVAQLQITRDMLEHMPLPSKVNGRLQPSPLQLAAGTVVVLDVTRMETGPLSPKGLHALQALQELAASHQLTYTFDGGVKIAFEADVVVLVVGTAAMARLLPCSMQVAVGALESQQSPLESLVPLRDFVGQCQSLPTVRVDRSILGRAEEDFVQRRQASRQARQTQATEHDFHRWLTLARLVARSRGQGQATEADWDQAVQLDDQMASTLSA